LALASAASVPATLARDFLTGFFTTIRGSSYVLNADCFGSDFDSDLTRLIAAINNESVILTAAIAEKIVSAIEANCPVNDIIAIYNDTAAESKNGTLSSNALAHSAALVHDIKVEMNQANYTASNLGQTAGQIIDLLVYGVTPPSSLKRQKSKSVKFLEGEEFDKFEADFFSQNFSEGDVELFVDGFFEGVSSVNYTDNKCKNDITSVKTEIVEAFSALITAIKTRTNIMDAIIKVYELTATLKGIDANCHFTTLSVDLAALSTNIGIAKLVYRVATNIGGVTSSIKAIFSNYKSGDFRASGVSFGTLVKLTLNYSTI